MACLVAFALSGASAQAAMMAVAPGWHLLPGALGDGRGPDGNTILIDAPKGLIVVDTGRHAAHSDAILGYARSKDREIAAIINTHWHLDHSSGNRRLKTAFPRAPLYATTAIDRALAPDGFLARELARAPSYLESAALGAAQKEQVRLFQQTMRDPQSLRADREVKKSKRMRIAGLILDVRVAVRAVTDADVWLFDRRTRIAVLGDLVTFPAPFFETACPQRWSHALDDVWRTPFERAIPGHGPLITRAQFDVYRHSFNAFVACAASDVDAKRCAAAWSVNIAPILKGRPDAELAEGLGAYYVEFLRKDGGMSRDCLDRGAQ